MKRIAIFLPLITVVVLSTKIFAIEGFSAEQIQVRERMKNSELELANCLGPYIEKVNPNEKEQFMKIIGDESVCSEERSNEKEAGDYFNKFMRKLESSPPYKVSREEYKKLEIQYRKYSEEELEKLHAENCIYNGYFKPLVGKSSGSSECNAIASEKSRKRYKVSN